MSSSSFALVAVGLDEFPALPDRTTFCGRRLGAMDRLGRCENQGTEMAKDRKQHHETVFRQSLGSGSTNGLQLFCKVRLWPEEQQACSKSSQTLLHVVYG